MNTHDQFEAWAGGHPYIASLERYSVTRPSPRPGEYRDLSAQVAFEAWQASRAQALEDAARVCEVEQVDANETGVAEDRAYNLATDHCAAAIRKLKAAHE